MIVSRSGEILTNNHVIDGATKFKVVDVTTHRTYRATVVGYSVSRDVAVLRLAHASGLRTVTLGGGVRVRVGQHVFARGNAQGRGGAPKVARGQVIALHQQIVAKDETGDSESLNNMIATNAPVVPGYSGGPLEDAADRVLGIVTAGSTTGVHRGFAIPIKQALLLARKIESGKSSATVHVGPTAFLGVDARERRERRQDREGPRPPGSRRRRPRRRRRHHLAERLDDLLTRGRPSGRALSRARESCPDRLDEHDRYSADGHHSADERPAPVAVSSVRATTRPRPESGRFDP